jgi:hypothetical protein
MDSRTEAISDARKLCRILASAPAPDARAREIYTGLSRTDGWTSAQARRIREFGVWLNGRPTQAALKARCEDLLRSL